MPLPPLNRLRKSTVSIVMLLLTFVVYRLFLFKTSEDSLPPEPKPPSLSTQICLLASESGPINSDSVFNIRDISGKIYAYSSLDAGFDVSDTIWHIWYRGSEVVKKVACSVDSLSCVSLLSLDSLEPGEWSLDVGRKDSSNKYILLDVKQFSLTN